MLFVGTLKLWAYLSDLIQPRCNEKISNFLCVWCHSRLCALAANAIHQTEAQKLARQFYFVTNANMSMEGMRAFSIALMIPMCKI